jgi:hypothetical protein
MEHDKIVRATCTWIQQLTRSNDAEFGNLQEPYMFGIRA